MTPGDEASDTKQAEPPRALAAPPAALTDATHALLDEAIIEPPVPDAASLLGRIHGLAGLPERNHEDVVRELLVRLGHDARSIVFQQGRIDVQVIGADGRPAAVIEVKRSILSHAQQQGALRQAMDYAGRSGARLVVISDADRYVVYDRQKGLDYDQMLCGEFRLTAFRAADAATLDLLRAAPR